MYLCLSEWVSVEVLNLSSVKVAYFWLFLIETPYFGRKGSLDSANLYCPSEYYSIS
jgi:hypothetical protein